MYSGGGWLTELLNGCSWEQKTYA